MGNKIGVGRNVSLTSTSILESAAAFGRWQYSPKAARIDISEMAAALLDVTAAHDLALDACFINVVEDDLVGLIELVTGDQALQEARYEFRVITAKEGLRWLRLTVLPLSDEEDRCVYGILTDITPSKHAAVRERLAFELTEYLVGSNQLSEAIVNVIQLVCKNLGWEWGAYWVMEASPQNEAQLKCRYQWHRTEYNLGAFGQASNSLLMSPGQGLVGLVWESGKAQWVDDMSTNPNFLRRKSAQTCGLLSGFIFPVTYVSEDGERHSPGVLEFYSCLSRQPEAQLPKLSATIGALIAQTAQRLEKEAVIYRLAHIDELTGLSNRTHFHSQLAQKCESASRQKESFGLMFIDLDRFKPINDAFGHEAGNIVLREFAHRLTAVVPEGAVAGRLGGDEFALLVPCSSDAAISEVAERVLEIARIPFEYHGVEVTVSASVGVSRFPESGLTAPALLRSADTAMYRVKQNGRNGCDISSASDSNSIALMQASLARRLTFETELHHAIENKELFLVYQPIFDIAKRRLHAIEALVRWRRAGGELVAPDIFIPIAEQSHLIVEIGRWVMEQACADLSTLFQADFHGLKVHVNMAASEFTSNDLPDVLSELTSAHCIPPSSITLELTEGMLMKRSEQVISVMHKLRNRGFEISLDDFGMGHSSLAMLKNLPITSMKVDRSFVRDIATNQSDHAIAKTIVALGKHLQLDVIAEGIETHDQLSQLKAAGCHLIQGYLLSEPLSLVSLIESYSSFHS
ncbi:GGDEF domain-containing protein [Rhodoferax sp. GW822-FHT02A01]|uniref:GGDEF domain-containing protein n=1 Tax=Rhodoferax sp. GW822-FHT02A01 TaxID=3141537 RepID=UPI00315C7A5E